jgi:hypothetical protein
VAVVLALYTPHKLKCQYQQEDLIIRWLALLGLHPQAMLTPMHDPAN